MDDVDSGTEVDPTDSQPSMLKRVCACVRVCEEGEVNMSQVVFACRQVDRVCSFVFCSASLLCDEVLCWCENRL